MRFDIATACAVMLLVPALACGQTVYKSTMPGGKVIYGEKPAAGAVSTEILKPPPRDTGVRTLPPGTATAPAEAPKPQKDPAEQAQIEANLRVAEHNLREAESALEKGKEPLPGERTPGAVAGRSQLNEDYWKRQRGLEQAADTARQEIERLRKELGGR
jgi:hypothetical protein